MNNEDMQELIVSYVAAKLAIDQEANIPESSLELAKQDHESALARLTAVGLTGVVKVGDTPALSPRDFRVILSMGPSGSLVMSNGFDSASVAVSCGKVLDRYFSRFQ